jgi:hypothetical protein
MATSDYRKTQALLADENNAVPYRPKWAKALGSVTSAILLQQINYWWVNKGHKEFYKFRAGCSHELYLEGDSWIEELGFGDYEFDGALKSIATRVRAGDSKQTILDITKPEFDEKGIMTNANCLVIYWISRGHVPYFELNEALFDSLVQAVYEPVKANREKPDWQKANREKPVSQSGKTQLDIESGKTQLDSTEITRDYTEITYTKPLLRLPKTEGGLIADYYASLLGKHGDNLSPMDYHEINRLVAEGYTLERCKPGIDRTINDAKSRKVIVRSFKFCTDAIVQLDAMNSAPKDEPRNISYWLEEARKANAAVITPRMIEQNQAAFVALNSTQHAS